MINTFHPFRVSIVAGAALLALSLVASAEIMMTDSTISNASVLSFASLQEPTVQPGRSTQAGATPAFNSATTAANELGRITIVPMIPATGLGVLSLDQRDSSIGLYDPDIRIKQFAMRSQDATTNFIWLK